MSTKMIQACNFASQAPGGPYSIKKEGKTLTHNRKYDNGEEEAPRKHLLEAESHSKLTLKLIERDPELADLLREKLSGALLKFAAGTYHDDFTGDMSKAFVSLSREMYHAIRKDQNGDLVQYTNLFTNFVSMVGNIGFCGSIPSFRFKVKFVETGQQVWLSLFYTPTEKEDELIHNYETELQLEAGREGLAKQSDSANRIATGAKGRPTKRTSTGGRSRSPSAQNTRSGARGQRAMMDVGLEGEIERAAAQRELGALLNHSSDSLADLVEHESMPAGPYSIKQEGKTLTHNRNYDGNEESAPHNHLLEAESHSKMTIKLINRDPGLADILREKLSDAVNQFSTGTYEDDLTKDMSRSYVALAKEMFHAIRKNEDGRLTDYSHLFTNFMCCVGNMGYCGSIPCFRFKVKFVKTGESIWLSLFYTATEQEDMALHNCETRAQLEAGREGLGKEVSTVSRLKSPKKSMSARDSSRGRKIQAEQGDLAALQTENAALLAELEAMRKGNGKAKPLKQSSQAISFRDSSVGREEKLQQMSPMLKAKSAGTKSASLLCLRESERADKLQQKLVALEAKEKAQADTNRFLFSELETCEAKVVSLRAECQCERTSARAATLEAEAMKAGAAASLAWAEQCAASMAGDSPVLRTQLESLQRSAQEAEAKSREFQAMSLEPPPTSYNERARNGTGFDPSQWAAKKKQAMQYAENLRAAKLRMGVMSAPSPVPAQQATGSRGRSKIGSGSEA